jgi:PAS domain S-box-containing protein
MKLGRPRALLRADACAAPGMLLKAGTGVSPAAVREADRARIDACARGVPKPVHIMQGIEPQGILQYVARCHGCEPRSLRFVDRKSILWVVGGYAIFASVWILLSDTLLHRLLPAPESHLPAALAKGLAFVLVTALILYWLLRRIRRAEAARYQAIFENHHAVMLLIDPESGGIVDANPAAAKFYGWPRERLRKMGITDINTLEFREWRSRMERALNEHGGVFQFQHRLADGSVHEVEVHNGPTWVQGRELLYSIVHDVTARKIAEEKLQRQRNLYAAISEINQAIVRLPGNQDIFQHVCRIAVERVGFLFAWVGEIDTAASVRPVAQYGEDAGYVATVAVSTDAARPSGRGPTGNALRAGRVFIANDFMNDPATAPWREAARKAGVRASGAFPIHRAGAVVAALNVYAAQAGYFDEEVVRLLEEMALDVSFALDNADRAQRDALAMAKLAESEERFRQIADNIREVFWLTDPAKNRMLYISPAYEEIWGRSRQSLYESPWSWAEAIHPEDRERVLQAAKDRQTRGDYAEEYRICRPDGAIRWIRDKAFPVPDANGTVVRVAGVAEDITERKKIEDELKGNEARYRELFEANPYPMWVYDLDTLRFLAVNDAAILHYGYTREEFLAMTIEEIRPPDEIPKLLSHIGRGRSGYDHAGVWRHRKKNGEIILVEINSHTLTFNGHRAELVLAQDVTSQMLAKERLTEQEEKFRALSEQSIAGIYMIDDGLITYMNPRGAEIFGYGPEEVTGRPARDFVFEEDWPKLEENVRRRLSGEVESAKYEFRGRRKDGSQVMIGVHGSVASIGGRRIIIGVLQDITDKHRAEQMIQEYIVRLERAMLGTVDAVSKMVELRDPYTSGHQQRVGELAAAIAEEMGLGRDTQQGLRIAGGVHDIGKIVVPAEILSKPGRLNPIEYEMVRTHAQQGYEVLKSIDFPWPVAEVARQHHERIDGSGYPRGLKGEEIILEARILAVADVVESMASHRPYRPGLGIAQALREIENGAGRLYDPQAAAACLRLFREKGYSLPG